MPMYDFKCPKCGHVTPVILPIEQRDSRQPVCDKCSGVMRRVQVYAVRVAADYEGYVSPASGKWVEGKAAHREDLARSGCRLYEPGETQAFMKRKERDNTRGYSDAVDRAVETAVAGAAAQIGLGG